MAQDVVGCIFSRTTCLFDLEFLPKVKIKYPSELKGQLYIPSINWLLFFGCVGVVLHFEKSSNMEHAYGLAIILCMIMTTILLNYYMILKKLIQILVVIKAARTKSKMY